jgi:hypothetical protein
MDHLWMKEKRRSHIYRPILDLFKNPAGSRVFPKDTGFAENPCFSLFFLNCGCSETVVSGQAYLPKSRRARD